jgi:hypothetical protein
MPVEGTVFDGFTSVIAQDATTHPSYLPEFYVSESVNRTFRGGINRTRPSIRSITLVAGENQPESIVNDIRNGNFQGAYSYKKTKQEAADGILISVAGVIYFLKIINHTAYAYKLIDGNDPSMMHTWFVQAEDRAYIQNGYQNPIAWDGDLNVPAYRLNPFQGKMPIGTIMEYAFGRVFVADRFNQIYASDIIFGNGFTDTQNTENFTEITYWAGGGAFATPSSMGNITAMKVMPYIGGNLRGQGELVVLTENGAFSMDVGLPRVSWTSQQIQRISLLGRGCASPYVTTVNSELWFRSYDGWAFYSNSQSEFGRYFSMRKLSREVNKWVDRDTPWLKQFASTMYNDNYLLSTVAPEIKRTTARGLHRYHRGIIVLDLDQSASPAPDAQLTFRWNGIWTGVRPTQVLSAKILGEDRGFVFSFDNDDKNRLYEVTNKQDNDFGEQGSVEIESFFITGKYDFSKSERTSKFLRKRISGGEMWMSEIKGNATSSVEYRSDSNPCWYDLMEPSTFGCNPCAPKVNDCFPQRGGNLFKRFKFNTPDSKLCSTISEIPAIEGSEFQLRVNITGSATVDRLRLMANIKNNEDSPVGDCPSNEEECSEFLCCQERYWDYSINQA